MARKVRYFRYLDDKYGENVSPNTPAQKAIYLPACQANIQTDLREAFYHRQRVNGIRLSPLVPVSDRALIRFHRWLQWVSCLPVSILRGLCTREMSASPSLGRCG